MSIKNFFIWLYIILSIVLWTVVIGGAESIIENKLLGYTIAICLLDILIGKLKPIQDFLKQRSKE